MIEAKDHQPWVCYIIYQFSLFPQAHSGFQVPSQIKRSSRGHENIWNLKTKVVIPYFYTFIVLSWINHRDIIFYLFSVTVVRSSSQHLINLSWNLKPWVTQFRGLASHILCHVAGITGRSTCNWGLIDSCFFHCPRFCHKLQSALSICTSNVVDHIGAQTPNLWRTINKPFPICTCITFYDSKTQIEKRSFSGLSGIKQNLLWIHVGSATVGCIT